MSSKLNNHQISDVTLEKLAAYLEKNDLNDVFVSVNQYAPRDQWRRLRENQHIAPGWRYSIGAQSVVGYTLLPGRIFGGDRYNPFTNSLYVNSDVPAVVLYQAAYAKDVHGRRFSGTYSAVGEVPLLSLWRQTLAVSDVTAYARAEDDWEVEDEVYHVLYADIGAHSAMGADPFVSVWAGSAMSVGGAVVGHIAGRTVAARRAKEREKTAGEPADATPKADVQFAEFEDEQEQDLGRTAARLVPIAAEKLAPSYGPATPAEHRSHSQPAE